MVDRDIILGKIGVIQRCLRRIQDVTKNDPELLKSFDVQDIFVLNLQRAAQATIDIAAHIVSTEGLGVPHELKENFVLLERAGIVDARLSTKMQKMVGFQNLAVHDYQELDPEILKAILTHHLKDIEQFCSVAGRTTS
ncbi:MAG TPA: transcriptional regulator [Bacteroidetes bacterium]|nr:transcriptional regulator [Bacteroidota bacterium]